MYAPGAYPAEAAICGKGTDAGCVAGTCAPGIGAGVCGGGGVSFRLSLQAEPYLCLQIFSKPIMLTNYLDRDSAAVK